MSTNALGRNVAFGLLLSLAGAAVEAETINCTPITSLPAVISSQGVYCLTGHLATSQTSGAAISIDVPNVVLDLNGWKVGGQGAGKGTEADGIWSDQINVTIKNGTVRGFEYGIVLFGSGSVVEDIRAEQNTVTGILVLGDGAIVRRNQVVNTGGSTIAADVDARGIWCQAQGVLIENNTVSGLYPVGSAPASGIEITATTAGVIRGNTLSGSGTPTPGYYGISLLSPSQVTVIDNVISNFEVCVWYGPPSAGGIYARNVADGCTTKYYGGTAGSGND